MAFTKIVSPGIDTTGSYTVQELNTVGVMTAGTVQVGAATTVHTTGIDLGSGNITSHNINSTGIITATSFVGPVTGNITGDITATSGTFSGNVSIAGTLTYEDVTNVDSVGLITARDGIILKSSVNNQQPKLKIESYGEYGEIKADGNGSLILDADPDFNSSDSYIGFKVDGSEKARITSAGLIGIGTTNPATKLHLSSGSATQLTISNTSNSMSDGATMGTIDFAAGLSNTINARVAGAVEGTGEAGGDLVFETRTDGGSLGEKLRITGIGSVGVGVADPDSKFHVKGNSTTSSGIFIHNANGATNSSADLWFGNWSGATSAVPQARISALNKNVNTAATDLIFEVYTGSTTEERLRITSAGHVNIGGASPSSTALTVKMDTNKHIGFSPLQSEVGNVPALVAFQDNGSLQDMGFRGVTLRFATGNAERLRITNDGRVGLGTITPGDYDAEADNFVVVGSDHTGITIASTGSSKRTNLYFADGTSGDTRYRGAITYDHNNDSLQIRTSGTEGLRIDSDRNVNIGNKDHHSHNGTVDSLQIGYALNLYEDSYTSGTDNYAIWANNAYYRSGGGNYYMRNDEASRIYQQAGEMWFQNAAAGTAENAISFDTKLRITSGGNFHLSTGELKTAAGDKFANIRGGGVINTKRLATGAFGNSPAYIAQSLGYIGDYMHYGCNAIYYLAQTTTGNSGYSSHMFSWYDSGHWGHYGKFVLFCQESGYIGGMAHRYLSGTTVSDIFSFGNTGSVSTTSTTTGSGTHAGQSVTRYDCTVSHTSTYRTMRWYLGILHGAQLGVTGSGKTQSQAQTYANSNGSLLHLFGVSDSNLTMAPNYRTW